MEVWVAARAGRRPVKGRGRWLEAGLAVGGGGEVGEERKLET
jgi:hypothetical protein